MKDSKSIISHLVQQPSMKKYEQMRCYDKLLSLLPKSFTSMIRFVYTKNETLFFVLNHPCAKMEFNYKRNLIKSLLKELLAHFPECSCLQVKEVQSFVTNQKSEEDSLIVSANSEIFYAEQATGEFETLCDDPNLRSLFDAIKDTIAKNRSC
jgi:hypothetical protein